MISIMTVNIWRGCHFTALAFSRGCRPSRMTFTRRPPSTEPRPGTASSISRFHYCARLVTVVLLLSTILTFADFQIVYALTGGGPANLTQLFATYSFQVGLRWVGNRGLAQPYPCSFPPSLAVVVFLTASGRLLTTTKALARTRNSAGAILRRADVFIRCLARCS